MNFIEPYFTTKCTSHNEDYHNALWCQYCIKNTGHNVRTRVTEARVAVSVINYNDGKQGFIVAVNSSIEMEGWNISQQTGTRLVRKAEESIICSEKTRHKQKMVDFNSFKPNSTFRYYSSLQSREKSQKNKLTELQDD